MKTAASDKGIAPHQTPHLYPLLPADIGSQVRMFYDKLVINLL